MAAVDTGGAQPRARKGTGLRKPRRRLGIRIDMTPMVDIAFLLLIFYMVTTIFSSPQAMEVNLPPDRERTVEIAESHLLTFRVDEDGTIYWNIGKQKPQSVPFDSVRALLLKKNLEEPKLVTLVKIHKKAKYSRMVDIVDEIQVVEKKLKETNPNFSYRFSLLPLDDKDIKLLSEINGKAKG